VCFIGWENLGMINLKGNSTVEILMILKNHKYATKNWNWDIDVFKRMNIVVEINKLFMVV
jgi:hypothetical protein